MFGVRCSGSGIGTAARFQSTILIGRSAGSGIVARALKPVVAPAAVNSAVAGRHKPAAIRLFGPAAAWIHTSASSLRPAKAATATAASVPLALRHSIARFLRTATPLASSPAATAGASASTPTGTTAPVVSSGASTGSSGSGSGNDSGSGGGGSGNAAVSNWLFAVSGLVFVMILLGGLTRLTRSGLSMVEWKFHGERWPQNDAEWQHTFEQYKKFPEFKKVNSDMAIDEFQFIYFMEYAHRMLGRVIGVAFVAPLAVFAARKQIPTPLKPVLALLLAMGTAQGFVGWWMVRSGLKENTELRDQTPRVSPYRLAFHLLMAIATYSILFTTALRLQPVSAAAAAVARAAPTAPAAFRRAVVATGSVLGVTVISGAFVAGNHAGLIYNEWPLMGGRFVPSDIRDPTLQPAWRNAFEHSPHVQFQHRCMAYASALSVGACFHYGRRLLKRGALPAAARQPLNALFGVLCAQLALGITTLLMIVPVPLGSAHQAGAITLLTSAMWLHHRIRPAAAAAGATTAASAPTAIKAGALAIGALALTSGGMTGTNGTINATDRRAAATVRTTNSVPYPAPRRTDQ